MNDFEAQATAKMKTFEKFGSPGEAIEKLTLLAVALIQNKLLTDIEKKIIADCVMDYIALKTTLADGARKGGKVKKYQTETERRSAELEAQKRYNKKRGKPTPKS